MAKKKNSKRILSVKIIREVDTSPDTSYLGEYSNSPANEFSIDRAHAEDCESLRPSFDASPEKSEYRETWSYWHKAEAETILEYVRNFLENESSPNVGNLQQCFNWDEALRKAIETVWELENTAGECDCSGGDMERHQYRYFNPSFNYVTKDGKPRAMTAEDVRKYTREDYERMERLNRGDWRYLGIRVEAQVQTHGQSTIQRISSGGLWGIESDSERSYFDEVAQDELRELKNELLAIGFSRRAIAKAFETVEGENS